MPDACYSSGEMHQGIARGIKGRHIAMKNRKWILVAFGVLLVTSIAAIALLMWHGHPGISQEDFKIRVGYKANSGFQNFLIAQEEDLFTRHGVQVEGVTFESTDLMMQALALGQIDGTPAGSVEVVAAMEEKSPDTANAYVTLVFTKESPYYTVLVPANSPMKSLADLKGKKVGTNPGSTAKLWLQFCLKQVTDPTTVQIVPLQHQLQLQALSAGEIDALYTGDPLVTIALVKGIARVLIKGPENQYMFDPMATGIGVLSSRFTKAKPEAARRFIAAMNEVTDYMRANEKEARTIIAKRAKLDAEVAERMDLLHYWKLQETQFPLVQKYLDYLRNEGILKTEIKAEDLYLPQDWATK
jgi:NitT/TauT family transport system substrate-binding protein